ncbi:unnamed protein product [marine sediment metagenome]|uniref:Uncharacterized protein n=1 Tax=marine sediment metagenome TaxID=412755 RepID=X0S428_9ZZZZ
MIVLIDIKSLTIKLYSESGMRSIPFEEAELLKGILKNNKAIYVTNAMMADASSIIQTVAVLQKKRSVRLQKAGEQMYLRSTLPGPLNIPNIRNKNTGRKETLIFQNAFDPMYVEDLVKDYGEDIFKRNKSLKGLLQSGKLQILGESEFEDQKARFKRGELKLRSLKDEYVKYMKLMSREESENEILFDITKSTNRMGTTSERQRVGGRGANETTITDEVSAWDSFG